MLNKIIGFLTSKTFLACVALLLVGVAIWFIGPLLAFDNLRPLASVGIRVTVIVLLLALALFALAGWPVSIVGLAATCILIWHAGPLLRFGAFRPLESGTVRLAIISALILIFLIWGTFKLFRIMRQNPEKLDKVLSFGSRRDEDKLAEQALKEVSGVIGSAMAQLKRMRTGARGLARVFEGKRYLYELPWYMIVGNPGAGKTTALLNSGLRFPLADQMGAAGLRGQGGTANCVWWLTNEAVLIDTAGRYANHAEGGSGNEQNAAEWRGFLKLLRHQRPRAPINGVLATISVADLLGRSDPERNKLAADLRARLGELRETLGIRFPVYLVVTKMDLVAGFESYFSTLTSEARNQVWGFTLPYTAETGIDKATLRPRCLDEFETLARRLDDGVNARLQEEFDVERRRRLSLLPQEFESLIAPLVDVVEAIFMDSRFDATQSFTTLRGVYFTSAAQAPATLVVNRDSLWQRLRRAFTGQTPEAENAEAARVASTGNRSYFVHDLLTRLVFAEAHLVRPNLRWEFRFRMLRVLGHALVVVIFVWLLGGILVSADRNRDFLATIHQRNAALLEHVKAFYAKPANDRLPAVLDEGASLTAYNGLDPQSPDTGWRYGLYSVPEIVQAGNGAYAALTDHTLLPFVIRRMESTLAQAIADKDERLVHSTLRVYLQMHSKTAFNAADVKAWTLDDWTRSDSAAAFGGKATMLWHINRLFDGHRVVQSPYVRNDDLVARARDFLDTKPSLTRVYERLKSAMLAEAPEPFTVLQAVGPQAGTVFVRTSGAALDQGIPGLFTYDGYHNLFQKKLPLFLASAYRDDAWVMGRKSLAGDEKKNGLPDELTLEGGGAIATEVRRLFLDEYAVRWEEFLEDIHSLSGSTRAFNLQIIRSYASPDSPLNRLAKAVVRETTLSRRVGGGDKSLLDKAAEALDQQAKAAGVPAALRGEARMERQLVDNRFAALREIVTGEADTPGGADAAGGGKGTLDTINGLIDAYYTQLVVADNALSAGAIPPPDTAGAKLRMQSAKLPAPLRGVLFDLVSEGSRGINAGIGAILVAQTNANVSEFCRRAIEGKYPFAAGDQDVDTDDFVRLFSAGGLFDEFFQKTLQPYVDSSVKPWRYKREAADMPPVAGPSLEPFARAQVIRDAFFRDAAAKKITWKADVRVGELDPNISELTIDIDGQVQRYAHGPVAPWNVVWPGPRGGAQAELIASPRIRNLSSDLVARGAWALFRLLDKGQPKATGNAGRTTVEYDFEGRRAMLEINSGVQPNPIASDLLKGFKCP